MQGGEGRDPNIEESKYLLHIYRPETKFAKVMFLHVSVCPQGGSPGPYPGGSPGHTQRESPGPHRGGGSRDPHWGGLQAHTLGVCVSQYALRQPPPDGYCCGQYASYRNAFLFVSSFFHCEIAVLDRLPPRMRKRFCARSDFDLKTTQRLSSCQLCGKSAKGSQFTWERCSLVDNSSLGCFTVFSSLLLVCRKAEAKSHCISQ